MVYRVLKCENPTHVERKWVEDQRATFEIERTWMISDAEAQQLGEKYGEGLFLLIEKESTSTTSVTVHETSTTSVTVHEIKISATARFSVEEPSADVIS